jgi:proteasome lid subunit RPN8/RPN11
MKLILTRAVAEAMRGAALAAAPLEACGLCGGREGRVTAFHPLANADASGEHYRMRPEEQFAAVRAMRAAGDRLLAIWHSHPASPARMSEEDLRLAFTPETVYLITSLDTPGEPALRGFTVRDGRAEPVELEELT